MTIQTDAYVFASEYAVFDWGIPTSPRGNMQVHKARLSIPQLEFHRYFTPFSPTCLRAMSSGAWWLI